MTRRVEQVDRVTRVGELKHRRADRDAALLLELHPVAARTTSSLARMDGTGFLHGTAIQQELLGQRGLARVWVTDDGERASLAAFGDHVHG